MKVAINDIQLLRSVRPLDLIGYLHANGWKLDSERKRLSQTWTKSEHEILVPLNNKIDGFSELVKQSLNTLESVTDQDQPQLLSDIREGTVDKARLRIDDDDVADGTIDVASGSAVVTAARYLVWSAASSAADPRPHYPRRRPREASDYLKRVRLGQTEIGSFTVSVLCPVPPSPLQDDALHSISPTETTDPFERRVTSTLMRGLETSANLATNFTSLNSLDDLGILAYKGLSANLCDALLRTRDAVSVSGRLDINMSWSWRRPAKNTSPSNVIFKDEDFEVLEEVSRILKEFAPREEFELVGTIVKLERGEDDFYGRIVVRTFFDGGPKLVSLRLDEKVYAKAVQAHDERSLVLCFGDLIRDGNRYELLTPRLFRVITDTD